MHYLYQHRRLDTNVVFYVGIGTKSEKRTKGHRTEYERAYCKSKRSSFWKSVVAKANYCVDILFNSEDIDFIRRKEIELISFYGRRNVDEYGTLVNISSGGEFNNGRKNRNISIIQLNLDGSFVKKWQQLADIEIELKFLKTNIVKCCRKKQVTAYGYKWNYENDSEFKDITASSARKKTTNRGVGIVAVCRFNLKQEEFRTTEECALFFNLNRTTIHGYLNKNKKHKTHDIFYKKWS